MRNANLFAFVRDCDLKVGSLQAKESSLLFVDCIKTITQVGQIEVKICSQNY
jgi:hypothetical protein